MSAHVRFSGVPGLIIWGELKYRCLQLCWDAGNGMYATVEPGPANRFKRVRDAKAAAERLRDVLPWSDPNLAERARAGEFDREATRRALIEALTGKTVSQLKAEDEARREAEHRRFFGLDTRDRVEANAVALGHVEVDWARYGARSWRGRCLGCGATFKVPYRSMGDFYYAPGLHEIGTCPLSVAS